MLVAALQGLWYYVTGNGKRLRSIAAEPCCSVSLNPHLLALDRVWHVHVAKPSPLLFGVQRVDKVPPLVLPLVSRVQRQICWVLDGATQHTAQQHSTVTHHRGSGKEGRVSNQHTLFRKRQHTAPKNASAAPPSAAFQLCPLSDQNTHSQASQHTTLNNASAAPPNTAPHLYPAAL